MRILIISILFTLFCKGAFTQVNLDSLWAVWEDEEREDSVRLKALLVYNYKGYTYSNPDSSLYFCKIGMKKAKEGNYQSYYANFVMQKGNAYSAQSDYSKALVFFDESYKLYEKEKDKKGLSKVLLNTGNVYVYTGKYDVALDYYTKGLKLYEELGDKDGLASAYNNMGVIAENKGDYDLAIDYHLKSLKICEEIDSKGGICRSYLNTGLIYAYRGNYFEAINYYTDGLTIAKEIKGIDSESKFYNNLAIVYTEKGDYDKAIDYYNRSLKIDEATNDLYDQARTYGNIGALYEKQSNFEIALEYYLKGLDISKEVQGLETLAHAYGNIAGIFNQKKEIGKAIDFYNKALKIQREAGLAKGQGETLLNLANVYLTVLLSDSNINESTMSLGEGTQKISLIKKEIVPEVERMLNESLRINIQMKNIIDQSHAYLEVGRLSVVQKNIPKAIRSGRKAYSLAKSAGNKEFVREASKFLYEVYKKEKKFEKALEMKEVYISYRDSLFSEKNQKAIIQHEYRSQYEKQAAADSIKHLEAQKIKEIQIAKQETEIKNKRLQQYALFGGLGLVFLFALFMLKKNKEINKQKVEINKQKNFAQEQQLFAEMQKEELSLQHNQIKDSIDYAQTLQKAVLPSVEDVSNNFKDNFVYFQPKDVVSGDFFWTFSKNRINYLAVVDCTGHGVPGAFMTIVANNLLNEIVLEDFSTPKEIIEELHQRIKVRVGGHKNAKVRDSMDLGLLSYDASSRKVNFVGTHTSLYLVRNSKLQKIKGSKADIGYSETINVKEHIVEVMENDMLYFHSDGYPDQKGGEKGKKFYYQPIRTKFEEISLLNLAEQKSIMDKTFNDWKGANEQLDDVCMIGIRL